MNVHRPGMGERSPGTKVERSKINGYMSVDMGMYAAMTAVLIGVGGAADSFMKVYEAGPDSPEAEEYQKHYGTAEEIKGIIADINSEEGAEVKES